MQEQSKEGSRAPQVWVCALTIRLFCPSAPYEVLGQGGSAHRGTARGSGRRGRAAVLRCSAG